MMDDERFTQDAVNRLTPIEPSSQLRRMVAQLPITHPQRARSVWPFLNLWQPTLSMAAVALLGLFVGRELAGPDNTQASVSSAMSAAGSVRSDVEHDNRELSEEPKAPDVDLDKEADLDELLVLATAGDFTADDWDLSQDPEASEIQEGTF